MLWERRTIHRKVWRPKDAEPSDAPASSRRRSIEGSGASTTRDNQIAEGRGALEPPDHRMARPSDSLTSSRRLTIGGSGALRMLEHRGSGALRMTDHQGVWRLEEAGPSDGLASSEPPDLPVVRRPRAAGPSDGTTIRRSPSSRRRTIGGSGALRMSDHRKVWGLNDVGPSEGLVPRRGRTLLPDRPMVWRPRAAGPSDGTTAGWCGVVEAPVHWRFCRFDDAGPLEGLAPSRRRTIGGFGASTTPDHLTGPSASLMRRTIG
ncbi:hypothetical protein CBR_g37870 [Chara braunii]|uniref:Uncharacterized protein n=1 Tax=Chara braunii TaxID=69332 RepID=A0A388LNU7_CHABU|nr:hypothetical protein CBR_g37870 [Chara braunii]|eukprot:GBG83997.1 hypothetical protein CBR_g37870 [Chara braunii]